MAGSPTSADARAARALDVLVLTEDQRLLTVSTDGSGQVRSSVPITGLKSDETLVGIDRRPRDGRVYGVARASNRTTLYVITPSGAATEPLRLVNAMNGSDIVLEGTSFGVDFNPVPDALRIVSDTGQNLRAIPANRASTTPAPGTTFVDGRLNEDGAPIEGIVGAAYTNNVDQTGGNPVLGTRLFTVDADRDRLMLQDPPNAGGQVAVATLDRRTTRAVGFDIVTTSGTDVAYALFTQENGAGVVRLVTIDLASGHTTDLGALGRVRGIVGMTI